VDDLFVLLRRMAAQGLAIIIISHKLQEVMAISDRVVVLRQGQMVASAPTDTVDREQLAEMIVGRHVERPTSDAREPGHNLLSLKNITVVDKSTKRTLLDSINLELHADQILGVAGVSGNGQASLADVLSGLVQPQLGEYSIKGKTLMSASPVNLTRQGVARIPEDRHSQGIVSEMNIWENLLLDELGEKPAWRMGSLLDRSNARSRADELISSFDIRCKNSEQPAGLLSGGNIQKLILARNLARSPDVILANQPTRGLDEGAIAAVHKLLIQARDNGAGVLLISEDLDEILRLADQVVVIHNGKLSAPLTSAGLTSRELGLRMSGAM
jgi:simple sugar transport system ATP-binding protein